MLARWILVLFFLSALLELASQVLGLPALHLVAKPLLAIFLIAYYCRQVPFVNRTFLGALFFCWLGDVFLLFDHLNELFFMAGLLSFLVAHLLLILTYRRLQWAEDHFQGTQRVRLSFPVILVGTGLVIVLFPKLGDLKIPVMMYALVLTLMALQSIFRLGRTTTKSFWLVFFGAVSFMLSDSLLAINKFDQPIFLAGVWVMTTYITAIYLIVLGVLAHRET